MLSTGPLGDAVELRLFKSGAIIQVVQEVSLVSFWSSILSRLDPDPRVSISNGSVAGRASDPPTVVFLPLSGANEIHHSRCESQRGRS